MGKSVNYIVCLDFETGGLKCTENPVTQIGMEILDPITFKVIEKYSSYIYPYPKKDGVGKKKRVKKVVSKRDRDDKDPELYIYTDIALKYTNLTLDILYKKGKNVYDVMDDMLEMFKKANPKNTNNYKPFLLGQNIKFDVGFLQHMAEYCGVDLNKYLDGGLDFYGNFQPNVFDTLHLVKQYYAANDKVTSHKLGLMSDKLGVELVNAHSADADVQATSGIFKVLMSNMRGDVGDLSGGDSDRERNHFQF